ncbi:hypothetical protein D9M72_425460 [compost metagenome]
MISQIDAVVRVGLIRMEQRHVLNQVKVRFSGARGVQPKREGERPGFIGFCKRVGGSDDADHDVWIRWVLEQPDIVAIDRANAAVHADGFGKGCAGGILRENDPGDGFPCARRGLHEVGLVGDLR